MQSKLYNLYELRSFRAEKNSFVLGLETISNFPKKVRENGRKTLLDVQGKGSLRHIWQYFGPGDPPYVLEFYVDGEKEPSVKGTITELIRAARNCDQDFATPAASRVNNDSYNFYLPVPFEKSLKVDLVATPRIGLVFLQLDYRLEDDSMEGIRLVQSEDKATGEMDLAYVADREISSGNLTLPRTEAHSWNFSGDTTIRLEGPAIIRRLGLNAQRDGVRLLIRYDGEATAAVNVDLADFFGPFRGVVLNNNQAYFPMPFKAAVEIEISGSSPLEEWRLEADVEEVPAFEKGWGYFHANHTRVDSSVAFQPFNVLSTAGKGHFVGMSLYDTHHDHGGGDFAIIDAPGEHPSFLHGINGEDYFSFALFGKGENFPYSEAFDNDEGRMRVHLENVYPFEESLDIYWGVTGGLSPRAVAFWYQDSPGDLTLNEEAAKGREWQVFGPVTVERLEADGFTPDVSDLSALFNVLPDPELLDQHIPVEAAHLVFNQEFTGTYKGWAQQYADRSFLNLMYVYGHAMPRLGGNHHMGYYPRVLMAKTNIQSESGRSVKLRLSYDDPLQVFLNGTEIFADDSLHRGFVTRTFPAELREGANELLVKMLDTPNVNTMWAGINFSVLDE